MKNKLEITKYSFLFFLLVLIDQYSKFYVQVNRSDLIFKNYNFAFSLVVPEAVIFLIYAGLLTLLIFWFKQAQRSLPQRIGFLLILSGALSNIAERILRSYVIDFIHIHTGILNVADFYILAGIVLLLLDHKKESIN